jgi:hypothetical protein
MSRLIDADNAVIVLTNRLFEILKTHLPCVTATENQVCLDTCYKVAKFEIGNIPTAFDVDKVVEELEQKSDDIPVQYEENYDKGFDDGIWYAIDTVKRGGVE